MAGADSNRDGLLAEYDRRHRAGEATWNELGAEDGKKGSALRSEVRGWRRRTGAPSPTRTDFHVKEVGDTLEVRREISGRRLSEADLVAELGVDEDRWTCVHFEATKNDVAMKLANTVISNDGTERTVYDPITVETWRAHAKWKRHIPAEQLVADAREVADGLLRAVRDAAPPKPLPPPPAEGSLAKGRLLELNPTDLHYGMLAWAKEAGEDYDSEIARRVFRGCLDELVRQASVGGFEQILLVLGNDGIHSDRTNGGPGGQTTAGTPLDVDTRRPKMVESYVDMLIETILQLRERWPVDVMYVPGNHDEETSVTIAMALRYRFHNDPHVRVIHGPQPLQLYRWGKTVIGFTHKPKKSPKDQAIEVLRLIQGEQGIEWIEVHHGHLHRPSLEEEQGIRLRVVGSMAAHDAWHAHSGYFHQRVGEAFMWHDDRCFDGMYSVRPSTLEIAA